MRLEDAVPWVLFEDISEEGKKYLRDSLKEAYKQSLRDLWKKEKFKENLDVE